MRVKNQIQELTDKIADLEDALSGSVLIIELEVATNKQAEAYIKQLENMLDSYGIKYVKHDRLGQRLLRSSG